MIPWRLFGNDLIIAMGERDVGTRALARTVGTSASTVTRLTRHAQPCTADALARLCGWAGLSVDWYLTRG
jgi:plasmid maintenance system antidote protein VapI